MKKINFWFLMLLILVIGGISSRYVSETDQTTIVIGAAASLQDMMVEIEKEYEAMYPEVDIILTYSGSGTLQTQLEQGAPMDLLITAALEPVRQLQEQGLVRAYEPFLENKLVLITATDYAGDAITFENAHTLESIAIGDASSVPVGMYTKEVFERLGTYDEVLGRASLGLDVRQVLQWVESKSVEAGVVYQTDAYTTDAVQIVDHADEENHTPIEYAIALTAQSTMEEECVRFMAFCQSDKSQEVFENYGFSTISSED